MTGSHGDDTPLTTRTTRTPLTESNKTASQVRKAAAERETPLSRQETKVGRTGAGHVEDT